MNTLINKLNAQFKTAGVSFGETGKKNVPAAFLRNEYGSAAVTLFGAHVISYIPAGDSEVLMMMRGCDDESATLFGGIPVCWPWFGTAGAPIHGYARSNMWDVVRTGTDFVEFRFIDKMELRLEIKLGKGLEMTMTTVNTSKEPQKLSEALHNYFRVGEISEISLYGLKDQSYTDAVGGIYKNGCVAHEEEFNVHAEVDYVYDSANTVIIADPVLKRQIRIEKWNSQSTVVWNPWIEESKNIPGFGAEEYRTMICLESANAREHAFTIAPGETHSFRQVLSVEKQQYTR